MSPSKPPGLPAPCHPVLSLRRLAALCAAGAALLFAPGGRAAAPPSSADPDLDPFDMVLDAALGERAVQDPPAGSFAVGIEAALRLSSQDRVSFGALAFVQVPLDRLGAPRRRDLARSPLPLPLAEPPGAPPAPAPEPAPAEREPPKAPLLTPDLARGAVRAACKTARLDDAEGRLDSLASRARTSALLPELRLRATRAVDESESLAPTEYDPLRRTASGGTSTWLEARATFRLDRLVFADDEIAVERLRIARAAERGRLVARVLELLDAWQRARATEADPAAKADARQRAALAAAASEASLDVLTAGWFSKAIGARAAAAPEAAGERAEGARDRARNDGGGGRGAGEVCGPGDTRGAKETRGDREQGAGACDAKEGARDAKEHTRRAATRDAGAAEPSHDATHPSPEGRAATRKK